MITITDFLSYEKQMIKIRENGLLEIKPLTWIEYDSIFNSVDMDDNEEISIDFSKIRDNIRNPHQTHVQVISASTNIPIHLIKEYLYVDEVAYICEEILSLTYPESMKVLVEYLESHRKLVLKYFSWISELGLRLSDNISSLSCMQKLFLDYATIFSNQEQERILNDNDKKNNNNNINNLLEQNLDVK
jgi:hypothetical protein